MTAIVAAANMGADFDIGTRVANKINLASTGISAGSYGSATATAIFTVDVAGRITAIASTAISVAASSVSGLASIATSGSAADLSTGTMPAGRLPAFTGDASSIAGTSDLTLAASGVTAGSYAFPSITVDAKGRITSATDGTIVNDLTTGGTTVPLSAEQGKVLNQIILTGIGTTETYATIALRDAAPNVNDGDIAYVTNNGTGTWELFIRMSGAWTPLLSGTGIAAAVAGSLMKDGSVAATADLPMGNHKLTGLAAGTAPGDSARYEELLAEETARIAADDALQLLIDGILPASNAETTTGTDAAKYVTPAGLAAQGYAVFLGDYASLAALQFAYPVGTAKQFATISGGAGTDAGIAVWDTDDAEWVMPVSVAASSATGGSATVGYPGMQLGYSTVNSVLIKAGRTASSDATAVLIAAADIAVNLTASGLNGLDTGAVANSTWYDVYLISDGTTVGGLACLANAVPSMPGGYTLRRYIGSVFRTAGGVIRPFTQNGPLVEWNDAVNDVASGVATYNGFRLNVPPRAVLARLLMIVDIGAPCDGLAAQVSVSNPTTGKGAVCYASGQSASYGSAMVSDNDVVTSSTGTVNIQILYSAGTGYVRTQSWTYL